MVGLESECLGLDPILSFSNHMTLLDPQNLPMWKMEMATLLSTGVVMRLNDIIQLKQ